MVNAPQPSAATQREYIPKIFDVDATEDQKTLYTEVCQALAFDPEVPAPIPERYQIELSCRCSVAERKTAKRLADAMGLTRNTLILTAIKLGMGAIGEILEGKSA